MPPRNPKPPIKRIAYTTTEVAEMLGRNRTTVWRWRERGVLKPVQIPGGKALISAASLEKLLRGDADP